MGRWGAALSGVPTSWTWWLHRGPCLAGTALPLQEMLSASPFVRPTRGISSLAVILIGREQASNSAAGPGQPDLAKLHRSDQRAESPSGRASPSPSSKSLLLIKGINWHAAWLFKEAVASAVPGSSESHTELFRNLGTGGERGTEHRVRAGDFCPCPWGGRMLVL